MRLRGRVGERVADAPPMLGQRFLDVRGSLALGAQRLITFRPQERIVEARRATAQLDIETHEAREPDRDPLGAMGLGAVLGAHLYRADVSAGLPPREVRRVGLRFALDGMGARWL